MNERPQGVVVQLVGHASAVEADVIPVGRVVERRSVDFSDLPELTVTVDFIGRDGVLDDDLLFGEAVPVVEERLGLVIGQALRASGRCELGVFGLAHVVLIFQRPPFQLALELLLQVLDLGVALRDRLAAAVCCLEGRHISLALDPLGDAVLVGLVRLAKCGFVAGEVVVRGLDRLVELVAREDAGQGLKLFFHHGGVLLS